MISFELTQDQVLASEMLGELAQEVLRPLARPCDRQGALNAQALETLRSTGLIELALMPPEIAPRSRTTSAIALEALAHADAAFAVAIAAPLGFAHAVMEHGNAAQRARLAQQVEQSGLFAAAVLIQEPGFRCDVTAPQSRVIAQHGGLVLSGAKSCVPRAAQCSDFMVTVAGDDGLAAVLVPADAPGVEVVASPGTLGLRSLALGEVRFHDVKLPLEARLGGGNAQIVPTLVDTARIATSAILTGISRAVFDFLVPYLKDRHAHGSALAQKQSVAFRLADMSIDIPSMRWMTWKAAAAIDNGLPAVREACLARIHCAEQAMWITDEGVQLMGGHGYMRENPVERWYRDVRTLAGLEGAVGL